MSEPCISTCHSFMMMVLDITRVGQYSDASLSAVRDFDIHVYQLTPEQCSKPVSRRKWSYVYVFLPKTLPILSLSIVKSCKTSKHTLR